MDRQEIKTYLKLIVAIFLATTASIVISMLVIFGIAYFTTEIAVERLADKFMQRTEVIEKK